MTIMDYPEGNKKNSNKNKKQLNQIEYEVGTAVPKSTQTRLSKVSHPLYIPTFSSYMHMGHMQE